MEGIHGAGKGDAYRQVNYATYCKNWDKIFGKKEAPKKKKRLDNNKKKK
jgi:sterol desaturase/sphingolipid hydroxylase (fatty acid hydroxylase superfamily)